MSDDLPLFHLNLAPNLYFHLVFQLHVVHYNSDKYKSFTEARDKPDGLAVLAFFYDVREPHTLLFTVLYVLLFLATRLSEMT